MKTITLRVPDNLHDRLQRLATKRNLSKSDVVREAIEHLLNGTRTSKPPTVLELAGDLVGCCHGPRDLATNPKYMKGFGSE